jgi:hypothetical protein
VHRARVKKQFWFDTRSVQEMPSRPSAVSNYKRWVRDQIRIKSGLGWVVPRFVEEIIVLALQLILQSRVKLWL